MKRTLSREDYWRYKCCKLETIIEENQDSDPEINLITHMQLEIGEIKVKLVDVTSEKDELLSELIELKETTIPLFDLFSNSFTHDTSLCVYQLLQHHVSPNHVGPVLEACLSLTGKKANKIPSASTVNNMNIERGILAKQQLAEVITDKQNTTLHTDETSKYGDKYGAFACRDGDGIYYTLGLRDLCTKSAEDTLNTLKTILTDIDFFFM